MCIVIDVKSCRKRVFVLQTDLSYIVTYFTRWKIGSWKKLVLRTTSNRPGYEMRTSVGNKHVPAFLTKLWKLVEDPGCDDLISWSESGNSFVIHNDVQFAKELLPLYFKHNHMASFVRQLNMYGFRKLNHIEYGGMHYTSNEIEFYHQYFIKGQESLLKMIKRKVSNSKISELPESKPGCMKDVALSIKDIKDQQQSTEKMVKDLKQQNEILWKQLAVVNDRCVKQQRLLTELVPIFFDMVQPSPGLPYKRKAPLMIDDGLAMKKIARLSPQYLNRQKMCSLEADAVPSSPFSISNSGPVIRDVTEMETKKTYADDISRSPEISKESEVFVDSPLSCKLGNSEQMLDSHFADREVMGPFNVLNFSRNCVTTRSEASCEQPVTMVTSTPSPRVPFHADGPDVKSPAANSFSPFSSLSTVSSPSLDSCCSPAVPPGDDPCHSEFCGSDKNIPAMKAMLDSVSDQTNILSNSPIRDTCLSTAAEIVPSERPYTAVANTCNPPLLLTSNVQATALQSPVTKNHLNPFDKPSSASSSAFVACSPVMSASDNSHHSENHASEDKIKVDTNACKSEAGQDVLISGNFNENARGADANLSWLGSSDNAAESNIDNWLGQLLRSEGIITSCDLDMSYNI